MNRALFWAPVLEPLEEQPPAPSPDVPVVEINLPEFAGITDADIERCEQERRDSMQAIRQRCGTELSAWLKLYHAQYGFPSPSTVKGWRLALGWFREFVGSVPRLDDLQHVPAAMEWLRCRGRNPESVKLMGRKLVALWRFAHDAGAMDNGPPGIAADGTPRKGQWRHVRPKSITSTIGGAI